MNFAREHQIPFSLGMAALNQQAEWKLCDTAQQKDGVNPAAQGRSCPCVGQSQPRTSQFAFYQLNSQHTELQDSSNPIFFCLFTSVFTESAVPFICNSGIMTGSNNHCWLWGHHTDISPVLRFSDEPSLYNSELDPVAQQQFCKVKQRSIKSPWPGWAGFGATWELKDPYSPFQPKSAGDSLKLDQATASTAQPSLIPV